MELNGIISDSIGVDSTQVSSIKVEPKRCSERKSALLANY